VSLRALLDDPGVARIFAALDGGGEDIRIAGGAVRDALLGRMPGEVDFATTALPDEITRRAVAASLRTVPTGIAHGTVTVIVDGRPFEVTTLRRDVDTDGRHAIVAFGRDWAEDALRRDFTINGLFLDRDGQVHDFTGGETDLKARRVRFIGEARQRIREDYLRILRFFRFFAAYAQGEPDGDALAAVIAERRGLERLSRERIRAEIMKLLVAPRAPEAARIMADAGLLGAVLAGVARPLHLARMTAIEAALGRAPDALLRLGALGLFVADNAERLRERLRLSNEETSRLHAMATRPPLTPSLSDQARKAALYRRGEAAFRDAALLAWADSGADANDAAWRDLVALPDTWTAPKFPLSGKDLAARGVAEGPAMGARLRDIEERWIAAGFPDRDWIERELGT